jgi:transglutaminase-like putative cysteine protease
VELRRQNPFDFVLDAQALRLPLVYPEPLQTALTPYCHGRDLPDDVRQFAQEIAAGVHGETMSFLMTLNQRLFQTCRHTIRPEGPPWTAQQTLHQGEGSCRDLAVLFCDACRAMGIAARFVSGYDCATDGQADSYMHAWAEVHLPEIGWRGFDPSRGLAVTTAHVPVAAAFDHKLAAPITGQFWGQKSRIETSLSIQADRDVRA